MFENNPCLEVHSPPHLDEECEKIRSELPAKSSVKVSIPIEDEQQPSSISDNQTSLSRYRENASEILTKFGNYAKFHGVEPYDIWEDKKTLQYLLFVDIVQKKLGYKFKTEEILTLKAISQNDHLSTSSFQCFDIWQQKSNLKASILTIASQKSLFDIKKKRNSSTKNLHMMETRKSEEQSFIQPKNFKKTGGEKSRMRTTCDQLTKTFLKSGFVTDECKDNKIQALREDLQMNALEKKWELVVMAGQMNKWIYDSLSEADQQNNRVPVLFKIVNNAENFTIVKVDDHKHEQVIPQVVFYKKYYALKKKQSSNKDIEPKVVNQAILGLIGANQSKSPTNKFNQRDKDLNEALLHIMRVKNILQYQHKMLSESAINT